MSLNCGCPQAASLPSIVLGECKEKLGQIQKLIFQRVFSAAGTKNAFVVATADPTAKATWQTVLTASDGTKAVITPYVESPESTAGGARTWGGGNDSLGGIERITGREPSAFTGKFLDIDQLTASKLKRLSCENLGVFFVDEFGRIAGLADNLTTPTKFMPVPIQSLFIGDKKMGMLTDPDENAIQFALSPNWSDKLKIYSPDTSVFNPLTDLVNV